MSWLELIVLSLALSIDSLAVSIATSPCIEPGRHRHHAIMMGLAFGASHAFMIILGWFTGEQFMSFISEFDHWVAFGLLAFIGGKMIWESLSPEEIIQKCPLKRLPTLCLATSIDALGVGLSFAIIEEPIIRSSLMIGGTVMVITIIGVLAGKQLRKYFGHYAELFGGLILIAIGFKILLEHLPLVDL